MLEQITFLSPQNRSESARPDAFNSTLDVIADLQRTYAFRRAWKDQFTEMEAVEFCTISDQFRYVPDQLGQIGRPSLDAVHRQNDAALLKDAVGIGTTYDCR